MSQQNKTAKKALELIQLMLFGCLYNWLCSHVWSLRRSLFFMFLLSMVVKEYVMESLFWASSHDGVFSVNLHGLAINGSERVRDEIFDGVCF